MKLHRADDADCQNGMAATVLHASRENGPQEKLLHAQETSLRDNERRKGEKHTQHFWAFSLPFGVYLLLISVGPFLSASLLPRLLHFSPPRPLP